MAVIEMTEDLQDRIFKYTEEYGYNMCFEYDSRREDDCVLAVWWEQFLTRVSPVFETERDAWVYMLGLLQGKHSITYSRLLHDITKKRQQDR